MMRRLIVVLFGVLLLTRQAYGAACANGSANCYSVGCPQRGLADCSNDDNACSFSQLWPRLVANPGYDVRVTNTPGGAPDYRSNGRYIGTACMGVPSRSAQYPVTLARTTGGTATAGSKQLAVTYMIAGAETGPSPLSNSVTFSTNDQMIVTGLKAGLDSPTSVTARILYSTKAGGSVLFKLPAACQTPLANDTATSVTCDPGPDSGFGVAPPVLGVNGTSGNHIVIEAVNPGEIALDGQSANATLKLQGVSWMEWRGLRSHHPYRAFAAGGADTGMEINDEAHDNLVFDFGVWGVSAKHNLSCLHMGGGGTINNRVDNFYQFGPCRKSANVSQGPQDPGVWTNTFSRGILVYDWTQNLGPELGIGMTYNSINNRQLDHTVFFTGQTMPASFRTYNNGCQVVQTVPGTFANCPTAACQDTIECGTLVSPPTVTYPLVPVGMLAGDTNTVTKDIKAKGFGNIFITHLTDRIRFQGDPIGVAQVFQTKHAGTELKDNVTVCPTGIGCRGYSLNECRTEPPNCPTPKLMFDTNNTSIGDTADNIVTSYLGIDQWISSNHVHLANNSTFDYQGVSGTSRADVCTLHNPDGTDTGIKRWPHPLNADLITKMANEGLVPLDERAEVTAALGAIPAACDDSASPPATNTPTFTNTQTFTASPTFTLTPSATPTFTSTPTLTPTVTWTPGGATPTPSDALAHSHVCGPSGYSHAHSGGAATHHHPCYQTTPIE